MAWKGLCRHLWSASAWVGRRYRVDLVDFGPVTIDPGHAQGGDRRHGPASHGVAMCPGIESDRVPGFPGRDHGTCPAAFYRAYWRVLGAFAMPCEMVMYVLGRSR